MREARPWGEHKEPKPDTYFYLIRPEDLGAHYISVDIDGRREQISLYNFMGYVMPHDIGKIIVRSAKGIWQVENEEQFKNRTKNHG